MVRPAKIRRIIQRPGVSRFTPYGEMVEDQKGVVFLRYDEYEAIRLSDYEGYRQCESADIMQVSRPTFTRIYASAREKIAKAFVEGRTIIVEGGKVEYGHDWYTCPHCHISFNKTNKEQAPRCPLCKSSNVEAMLLAPDEVSKAEPQLGDGKHRRRRCNRRADNNNIK